MSVITGYLIQAFGWQKTFIFEGLPAVLWAFVWVFFVRDKPSQAQWISPPASAAIERQLALEQFTVPPVRNLREALFRRDVISLSVLYFCWSLGVYGFVLWLPTIIRAGTSTGMGRTGVLAAAPYLLAIFLMLAASHVSDRTQRRRQIVWPFLIVAGLALFASFLFAKQSFWIAYGALIVAGGGMYAPYGSFFAFIAETIPKTVFDEVLAFINSVGALGGFAGSWLVGLLQARTGNSKAGFLLMSGSVIAAGLLMLFFPRQPGPAPTVSRSSRSPA
jgi:nitrate/nitrite transporter NarK